MSEQSTMSFEVGPYFITLPAEKQWTPMMAQAVACLMRIMAARERHQLEDGRGAGVSAATTPALPMGVLA